MKNVIILGASGNIAKQVIDILAKKDDINLTLFLRNARRLRNNSISKPSLPEGPSPKGPTVNRYAQRFHQISGYITTATFACAMIVVTI